MPEAAPPQVPSALPSIRLEPAKTLPHSSPTFIDKRKLAMLTTSARSFQSRGVSNRRCGRSTSQTMKIGRLQSPIQLAIPTMSHMGLSL
jgi:hypothetical protein